MKSFVDVPLIPNVQLTTFLFAHSTSILTRQNIERLVLILALPTPGIDKTKARPSISEKPLFQKIFRAKGSEKKGCCILCWRVKTYGTTSRRRTTKSAQSTRCQKKMTRLLIYGEERGKSMKQRKMRRSTTKHIRKL
jgi:hypothetical protein